MSWRWSPSLLLMALISSGCTLNQGLAEQDPFGRITHTIGEDVPEGVQPAHVYEIDGEPVAWERRSHRLEPGEHSVRVWPKGPPQAFVPDRAAIEEGRVQVDPVVIEVQAGFHYFLGIEETRTRSIVIVTTREGEETSYGNWEITYRAVLVKEEPPATLERAAKGFGLFAGSLAAAPLLGPFLFGG